MVRLGVVGNGAIADNLHLPSLAVHPSTNVTAICSRNTSKTEDFASKFSIQSAYTDHKQMLEKERLDAAVALTPDFVHNQVVMDAIEAGCHVLYEISLAMSSSLSPES